MHCTYACQRRCTQPVNIRLICCFSGPRFGAVTSHSTRRASPSTVTAIVPTSDGIGAIFTRADNVTREKAHPVRPARSSDCRSLSRDVRAGPAARAERAGTLGPPVCGPDGISCGQTDSQGQSVDPVGSSVYNARVRWFTVMANHWR